MSTSFTVGITGGSASGKTSFLNQLLGQFRDNEVCLISQDNYYLPIDQQPRDHNNVENFDLPQSIDFDAYVRDITDIKAGREVTRKEYMFNNSSRDPAMLKFSPAPIIVVEGIFVLYEEKLRNLLDLKVYIDAKDHIKLKRRIVRDNEERGYDLEDVLYRWEHHVAPTYEKYIEPFKHLSDIVVPNNHHFEGALSVLTAFLKSKL